MVDMDEELLEGKLFPSVSADYFFTPAEPIQPPETLPIARYAGYYSRLSQI